VIRPLLANRKTREFLRVTGDLPFLSVVFFSLAFIGGYNYLLFHCLVECALAGVAFTTFAFAWNCRRFEHGYLLILGLSAGFNGVFHILHALAYEGMHVYFTSEGANLAPQLWVASIYLQAITLLVAPAFLKRPLPTFPSFLGLLLISAVLLGSIFTRNFPICWIPGVGLTPFKIFSEYVVSLCYLLSAIVLYRKRAAFTPATVRYLLAFFIFLILTELCFTRYASMFGAANKVGHIFLLFAYYCSYKAIVETGIRRPFDLLFRELKEAIQARDEFLSIASHELKTPLTPLKMQLQSLRRQLTPEKIALIAPEQIQRNIDLSTKQIDRLAYLIENLLDVSRISAGKLQLQLESIDAKSIFDEIVNRHSGEARALGMELKVDVPHEPLRLSVDILRMDQVITNLFMNALKYAPHSKLELGARQEGNLALLWVQDSGPGIPKTAQGKVFERFERSQPSDKVTGLGLGLFISRQIVEAHGGTLRLKSEPGTGSRFEVRLPLPTV
jgi:signal transduction histidine kinase